MNSEHIGKEIYLNDRQCDFLSVDYAGTTEDLICSAEALLRTKDYDARHMAILLDIGPRTIRAKPKGYGWFTITEVL